VRSSWRLRRDPALSGTDRSDTFSYFAGYIPKQMAPQRLFGFLILLGVFILKLVITIVWREGIVRFIRKIIVRLSRLRKNNVPDGVLLEIVLHQIAIFGFLLSISYATI
jgi:hypothetical protein